LTSRAWWAQTGAMPSALRSRLALLLMLGAFLIPIASSNMRGLGQLLTCEEQTESPFTLLVEEGQDPTILTSQFFTAEDKTTLCASDDGGGLELNPRARSRGDDRIELVLPIKNTSEYPWEGSVKLVIGGTPVPVRVGQIEAGTTEEAVVTLPNLDQGETVVDGSLLIGP
jgi:hypothetical protein